jgi:peptide deformylase
MALLEILTYPNKFLRQPTKPVSEITEDVQKLIDDMIETMYDEPGVGLAAIQVGADQSLIVYDASPTEGERQASVLINPEIVASEGRQLSENEGCLSVPDFRADVNRAAWVQVKGLDRDGQAVDFEAEGFLAIVLQHEIDHLNGVLFIDRISALKREIYKRKRRKQMRQQS